LKNTVLPAISITGYPLQWQPLCRELRNHLRRAGFFLTPRDSPVRNNFGIKGEKGDPIELLGKVQHNVYQVLSQCQNRNVALQRPTPW